MKNRNQLLRLFFFIGILTAPVIGFYLSYLSLASDVQTIAPKIALCGLAAPLILLAALIAFEIRHLYQGQASEMPLKRKIAWAFSGAAGVALLLGIVVDPGTIKNSILLFSGLSWIPIGCISFNSDLSWQDGRLYPLGYGLSLAVLNVFAILGA